MGVRMTARGWGGRYGVSSSEVARGVHADEREHGHADDGKTWATAMGAERGSGRRLV